MPQISSICATLSFTSAFVASRCSSNGSPMARPMVIRGFSALYGSWKVYCICGRIVRSSRWGSLNRSCPLNSTSPPVLPCNRSTACPNVVLPEPDSQTNPTASPT